MATREIPFELIVKRARYEGETIEGCKVVESEGE